MKLKKIISITIVMLSLSATLQGMMHGDMSRTSSIVSDRYLENLTPEQNEKIMDLRGEFVQREIQLNREIRRLRMDMKGCMWGKNMDLEDYKRIERESELLKYERMSLQSEYNKQVLELIKGF